MKNEFNTCETVQFSISEKFDECLALDHSENEHLESCSECQHFYRFVHGKTLQQIANTSVDKAFYLEKVSESAAIMEVLNNEEFTQIKKSNVIRLSIVSAAVAALAVLTISQVIEPTTDKGNAQAAILDIETPKKKVLLPTLSIPDIDFDEQYSAINNVVVNRLETVTSSIEKLKACFVEGNAFLDEHTQSESEKSPESYYFIQTRHTTMC